MTTVEVLAPVRLETRFAYDAGTWRLRLRVYPDEFSIRPDVPPPTPEELDRLAEAAASPHGRPDAFADLARVVGAGRALLLWRRHLLPDGTVDRTGEAPADRFRVHVPAGLPPALDVWFVHRSGLRERRATLTLDLTGIAADLDLDGFAGEQALIESGALPRRWWLSYERALEVGLGVDLDLGPTAPDLDALVVLGIGDTDAAELVDAHNAAGRLGVLAPGQPTNTVAGEPTVDLGRSAETLFPLVDVAAGQQQSTRYALEALTGRVPADALPLVGGDRDHFAPGSLAVQGLWPVLWGRSLRDVSGAGTHEIELAKWARYHLAVEGPRPAIRIADQPYGLLPTSAYASWVDDPGDPLAGVERRIRSWALPWRAGAAAAARARAPRVPGADTDRLIDVLGLHAPNRHWRARPVADLNILTALRLLAGMPPMFPTAFDRDTAGALRDLPFPSHPVGPATGPRGIPGPPGDEHDKAETLRELLLMVPETLYNARGLVLGLVGHLFRESLICAAAIVGEARDLPPGDVVLDRPLPLDREQTYQGYVYRGGRAAEADLDATGLSNPRVLADRHREVLEALEVFADLWGQGWERPLFRATLAALDTAAHRVDPWLTGIAERRLQTMITESAPFKLGAYGWVDAPAPYGGPADGQLAPGPTAAGLLHAPSHTQALTAAVLRDAAVRHPGDDRWRLNIDSAKVRASVALAERVRLGVHPYEALGLEVERLAGDWNTVRDLRKNYPLGTDDQQRRVCDGARVLAAARNGALDPALALRLEPLHDVLDTYADLLVADGVHALVSGRADLAHAAMEAAAGLGAPAELRAIRTPRSATTVRVACWALLEPGPDPGDDPAGVADPAYAALGGGERLAVLLGGASADAPVPTLSGGSYEGLLANADELLRADIAADLDLRRERLHQLADDARAALPGLDAPGLAATAARWRVDLGYADRDDAAELLATVDAAFAGRLAASPAVTGTTDAAINARRAGLRTLCGCPDLPVLPVVDRGLLPVLHGGADLDRDWLEITAAVRPRLAPLEARQLDPAGRWPAALAAPGGGTDPWHPEGPVLVGYGPAVTGGGPRVAIAVLDAWTDSVPGRTHTTSAAFGFNAPRSRAPQAVLLAVPPDRATRLDNAGLLDVVLETRDLVHARAAAMTDRDGLPYATPQPLVHAAAPLRFLRGWPA
ncbi:hypothetical protein R8Z50_18830 [Longispora sp. K20-0274]|uniref:hypothetical protein n=1 Tax=Longispora sp. K20-0274 TaxID=3088255 RepID=UPI00399AE064